MKLSDFFTRIVFKEAQAPKQESLYDRPCPECGGVITAVAKNPQGPVYCENGHQTPLPEFLKDQ